VAYRSIRIRPADLAKAPHKRRRGSLIVEIVVAAALFSTAVFALGRLAQQTASLSVRADDQLGAQLTGENILARLQAADYEQLAKAAKKIESADTNAPYTVQITTKVMKVKEVAATRLSVEINRGAQILVLHDWRFAPSENGND
jgi:Tfp pilus assembly protein PilV